MHWTGDLVCPVRSMHTPRAGRVGELQPKSTHLRQIDTRINIYMSGLGFAPC